jgi:hypothetical protein
MAGLLDFLTGGGGVLGGQSEPSQRRLPIDPDNPLGTGLQNFLQSRSPASAIGNLITGLTSGMHTDPVGSSLQMANLTYQGLIDAGVPEVQARLGATNPDVQRAIVARMFPTYTPEKIGNTIGGFSSTTGRFRPEYQAPTTEKLAPGESLAISQPPLFPGGGVMAGQPQYPRTQPGPIQASPLGAPTRAPVSQPSPLSPSAGAGPGGANAGPGATGVPGVTVAIPGMSLQEKARQEAAGQAQAGAQQGLNPAKTIFDDAIDSLDELGRHPGKKYAVDPLMGQLPVGAQFLTGHGREAQDFVSAREDAKNKLALVLTQMQAQARTPGSPRVLGSLADQMVGGLSGLDRAQTVDQFDRGLKSVTNLIKAFRQNAVTAAAGTPGTAERALPEEAQPQQPRVTRPPGLSGKLQYNAKLNQFRDANGRIYDATGKPVQ